MKKIRWKKFVELNHSVRQKFGEKEIRWNGYGETGFGEMEFGEKGCVAKSYYLRKTAQLAQTPLH